MKQKRKHPGMLAMLLGAVLMLTGALALFAAGDTMQYVFPAPPATPEGNELSALYEAGNKQLVSIADSLTAYAIGARRQGTSISSSTGGSVTAVLYAVGEGYFDVMHETLQAGRVISGTDVARADDVIVLDEKTALTLFPGLDPIGQTVNLNGLSYEVAGVIRGGRKLGEADPQIAYIPITSAGKNAMDMQTVQCVARGIDSIGSAILMEDTMRSWQAGGSFYNMTKLRLGAVMPLRWALLIVGVSVLLALLRRMNAVTMGRVCHYYEALRLRYARNMLPELALNVLLCAAGYAAILGLASALAVFSIQPLYVFTEWIPEVVVELSSLTSRFWALNDVHAAAIRCVTREFCVLELGEGLLRWGFMAFLLGLAMHGNRFLSRHVELPAIQRDR